MWASGGGRPARALRRLRAHPEGAGGEATEAREGLRRTHCLHAVAPAALRGGEMRGTGRGAEKGSRGGGRGGDG